MTDMRRRTPSRRRRWIRSLGELFLLGGMGRGVSHGGDFGRNNDHLLARAALMDEGRRFPDDDHRPTGLLEHVPGWIVLVVALAIFLLVLLTPR